MKNTKKLFGIMIAAILLSSQNTQAGWLSNLGERFVNGVTNTVINKAHQKTNKTVNDAMDSTNKNGQNNTNKIGNTPQYKSENISSNQSSTTNSEQIDSNRMLDLNQVKKKALSVTGKYEEIDFGTFKFQGERLYYEFLTFGDQSKKLDFYLLPGLYMVCFFPRAYDGNIRVIGMHEEKYGIKIKKYISNNGFYEMNSKKGPTVYIIEVSKNGGHFEMAMMNDQSKKGQMEFALFKIPDMTLK